MKKQINILLIDDNFGPLQYYKKALEHSDSKIYKVYHVEDPDSALKFLMSKGSILDLIILDIMLPPGKSYKKEDTRGGLFTGIFLFRDIKKEYPKIPIIFLTNVTNPRVLDLLDEDRSLKIFQKIDTPPFKLLEIIDNLTE